MAVELCSETISMSPRIPFSQAFCQSDAVPSTDFEFDVQSSFDQECYSPAGELFSNGKIKILPFQIEEKAVPLKQTEKSLIPPPDLPAAAKKDSSSEINTTTNEAKENESSRLVWRFGRSSSWNCVTGYKQTLTLLSRSKSTGSAPNTKPAPVSKAVHNNDCSQKYRKGKPLQCSSSAGGQKPPMKKTYTFGSHGNGVPINPVLNVPSVNLFCSGSFTSRSIRFGSVSSRNVVRGTSTV